MAAPFGNKYAAGIENSGRPPLYESAELMLEKIIEYFDQAKEGSFKTTITGLCLFLGFESRQSFYDYEDKEEFSYIVKRARLVIENIYEERLGDSSCTGAIFALKNMDWHDKSETQHSGEIQTTPQIVVGSDKAANALGKILNGND